MEWLLVLLLVGGIAAVAVAEKPVTEADVTLVVNHALVAETDPAVLITLQQKLSAAGRFELADLVAARAQGLRQKAAALVAHEIAISTSPVMMGGGAPIVATQPPPAPIVNLVQTIKKAHHV